MLRLFLAVFCIHKVFLWTTRPVASLNRPHVRLWSQGIEDVLYWVAATLNPPCLWWMSVMCLYPDFPIYFWKTFIGSVRDKMLFYFGAEVDVKWILTKSWVWQELLFVKQICVCSSNFEKKPYIFSSLWWLTWNIRCKYFTIQLLKYILSWPA